MTDGVAALRDQVTALAVAKLTDLHRAFPGLVVPRTFAGHPVDDQSSAHLLKAMSLLVSIGVEEIDGFDLRRRAIEIADATDPSITGFASFSFGESIVRLGGLDAVADPERLVAVYFHEEGGRAGRTPTCRSRASTSSTSKSAPATSSPVSSISSRCRPSWPRPGVRRNRSSAF